MKIATVPLTLVLLTHAVQSLHADYPRKILKDRPAAYWCFDELTSRLVHNQVTGVKDGQYISSAVNRHGVSGLAATFDGQHRAGRVEIRLDQQGERTVRQIVNGSFSLELWLLDEAGSPDGKTNYSILYKVDTKSFTGNSLWLYRARQDGRYHFRIHGRAGRHVGLSIPNPAGEKKAGDRKWHHLVITVNRAKVEDGQGRVRAFLDGKLVCQSPIDSIIAIDNDGPLIIGNSHSSGAPWQGGIDELALYDHVVDEVTVARHFDAGRHELMIQREPSASLAARIEFFELKVRPLLVDKCADCHSGEPESDSMLAIGSREALLTGGDYGPAIVPHRAADSLLIHAVKRIHKELRMPPDNDDALSKSEIADLARWINEGAVWGKTEFVDERPGGKKTPILAVTAQRSTHWSFQPRSVTQPPEVADVRWADSEIDRYVEAKRQQMELVAVESADRRRLIRRATLDLIGLPPTPSEVAFFLNDSGDEDAAFGRVINRLLASKHYGERQGRFWLDVVRYADTQGDVGDFPIPTAYRYRNWVIDSLNANMPFDKFLRAQIAGDLLARHEKNEAVARGLVVATGFIALSRRFGNTKSDDMHLTIEDTIDTLGRGVLGLTFRCARCHDHKFDPILSSDYYGLYGIFDSTVYPWMGASNEKSPSALVPAIPDNQSLHKAGQYWELISRYEYQINNHHRPWLKPTLDEFKTTSKQLEKAVEAGEPTAVLEEKRAMLLSRYKGKFRELMIHDLNWIKQEKKQLAENPEIEFVFAVSEGSPHDAKRHRRGDPKRLGEMTPRRFLQIIDGPEPPEILSGSGRIELARWITRPDHPLTARVIVNRIWQQHFGRGLVSTLDNFGRQGSKPSHPELLDWLAGQFVSDGWSLKKLHRRIMLSQTYRLSSDARQSDIRDPRSKDPENIYLCRFSRRRLEAEVIRDSMLAVTGLLDRSQGGPHPFKPWYAARYSLNRPFHEEFPTNRRSVYMMTQRLFRNSFLGLFDGPDRNSSTSLRATSNVPSQALYLMNSAFVKEQAEALARRLIEEVQGDQPRVSRLYQLAYGRDPDSGEEQSIREFITRYRDAARQLNKAGDQSEVQLLTALSRVVLTGNEFFFIE
jgi:hypothetical protein